MARAALKKTPQILYQKKTFFRHARRYCRKNLLLIYTNIAGGQAQELKTYFYEEKTVD